MTSPLRVLVLDEGFVSGSVTAEGLRDAGCVVDVIAATGGHGRCAVARGTSELAPRIGDPRLQRDVDRAVSSRGYDVVYPVTEPFQQIIWDWDPPWMRLVFPSVSAGDRVLRRDKRAMSGYLRERGVEVPRERGIADLEAVVGELGLPIVVKGAAGRGGQATHICSSICDMRKAVDAVTRGGSVPFAQEYIAGPTYLVGGLFDRGHPLRWFAGRKSVQFPPRTGPAAEIVSDDDPALSDLAARVFAAARVSGLASIDVVRDARGVFHFLELNPRPWGSIQAALDSGVDLFRALAAWWQSMPLPPSAPFIVGKRSAVFPLYVLSSDFRRSGRLATSLRRDVARGLSFVAHRPREALHQLHRLMRVGVNWSQPVHK